MNPERIRAALAAEPEAVTELMREATPIVQARVARALLRRPTARGRDLHHAVKDLVQEVSLALFTADGAALRAWDPGRGLPFASFIGLLAQRRVASLLRARHGMPWNEDRDPAARVEAHATSPLLEATAGSRELLTRLLEQLEATLSARGMELFHRLYVEQEAVEEACAHTGLSASAVYRWRRRLGQAAQNALAELQAERVAARPRAELAELHPSEVPSGPTRSSR